MVIVYICAFVYVCIMCVFYNIDVALGFFSCIFDHFLCCEKRGGGLSMPR